ncbi:MAG: DUF7344 domain-containing protein [Halobacteriota archaeon]
MSTAGGHVEGDGTLSQTEIHDVLRNTRRRLVIEQLWTRDGKESVRNLAEYIASVESGETPAPRNVRQSVYVSLHQTHLPKLDSLGIISYDSSAKEVSLAKHAPEVAVYLEVVPKYGITWGEFYLGVSLLGLLTLVAKWLGVPVLTGVDGGLIGGLFLGVIALTSGYRIITSRSSLVHRIRN